MKIYISGKIGERVISERTRRKFQEAEQHLKSLGHEVFNPASENWQLILESLVFSKPADDETMKLGWYQEVLDLCLQELAKCEGVLVLPDWRQSPGAKAEVAYAKALNLPVYEKAPNGRLFEIETDVVIRKQWGRMDTMTVGQLIHKLSEHSSDIDVCIAADFMLGEPFEQSFGKHVTGNIIDILVDSDYSADKGYRLLLDAAFSCSLSFD